MRTQMCILVCVVVAVGVGGGEPLNQGFFLNVRGLVHFYTCVRFALAENWFNPPPQW